jgi:hypothetical protein
MSEEVEEEKITIEISKKHAKKLAKANRAISFVIADILNKYGILGSTRIDYMNFAWRVLKILLDRSTFLWNKMIEVEKTAYVMARNLDKKVLDEIEERLTTIFKEALEEYSEIDFYTAIDIIAREAEKRTGRKLEDDYYGGSKARNNDS